MGNWYLGNYKKEGDKSLPVKTGGAKNEIMGPSGPPYALTSISVNIYIQFKVIIDDFLV